MKDISHAACASGGCWAAVPHAYTTSPEQQLLGSYTPPELLTVDKLLALDARTLQTALQQLDWLREIATPAGKRQPKCKGFDCTLLLLLLRQCGAWASRPGQGHARHLNAISPGCNDRHAHHHQHVKQALAGLCVRAAHWCLSWAVKPLAGALGAGGTQQPADPAPSSLPALPALVPAAPAAHDLP